MISLWSTPITLSAPHGSAIKADPTGLTAVNGWHYNLLDAEGRIVQQDCTAPALTVTDAGDITKANAQADIEAELGISQ